MKQRMKYAALAFTLGLMALIFYFSGQPAADSYKLSETVTETVQTDGISFLLPLWFDAENFHANLRKWAHVAIFAALGVGMALTVHSWLSGLTLRRQGMQAAVLCVLYAASDELHQYFVPGRAALMGDVVIDVLGILPGVAGGPFGLAASKATLMPILPPGVRVCLCGGFMGFAGRWFFWRGSCSAAPTGWGSRPPMPPAQAARPSRHWTCPGPGAISTIATAAN